MNIIENVTFDEMEIGQTAYIEKTLTDRDIKAFAIVSGDVNPVHLNQEYAAESIFKDRIAHGMWSGALISTVLGTKLPGPGTIYLRQEVKFKRPVYIGDMLRVELKVASKNPKNKRVILECKCTNQKGELVTEGEAEVIAPMEKYKGEAVTLPEMHLE